MNNQDAVNCILCKDAPCTKACGRIDPAGITRSIRFKNGKTAASLLGGTSPCIDCDAPCEKACVISGKVPVKKIINGLCEDVYPLLETELPSDESRLETEICGIKLENPFLLSSSVVASTYDMCARAFETGWAGVCFKTICSFEIHETSPRFSAIKGNDGCIVGFKNIEQLSDHSVEENMEIFRRLKEKYPSKVIIASIMGKDDEEWESLSRLCEENGADVIELNFSCPNMAEGGLGSDIGQIPDLVERFTRCAKRGAKIPVLAKLTPNVDSMVPAAEAAIRGGADGISAINTIKSITGVNIHTFVAAPAVHGMSAFGGYSGNAVKPIALRFIAELGNCPVLEGKHISGMGGVENWRDALEFMLLGAGSIQVTTAVMQYGYRIIDDLKSGLNLYLKEKGFNSVSELRGSALYTLSPTTDTLERDTVVFPKFIREKCVGCGRCVISCADGGHHALVLNENRIPIFNGSKCVGCHLCVLVCPREAIISGRKRIVKPE